MNQFFQWLAMGGYSSYVWPAYSIVFAVFMFNFLSIKWQKNRMRRHLSQWFKR